MYFLLISFYYYLLDVKISYHKIKFAIIITITSIKRRFSNYNLKLKFIVNSMCNKYLFFLKKK